MPKYLFGRVQVNTCVIEANSKENAEHIFADQQKEYPKDTKLNSTYMLIWYEDENHSPIKERDKVLQGFLYLMQRVIPVEREFVISRIINPMEQ